jgi:diguanylate cyclase (GGDEF)-like protein
MGILIVDDCADMGSSLKDILTLSGYRDVYTAASATEGFSLLGLDGRVPLLPEVDVILMDVCMPQIDGITACRRIKETEQWRDVQVIMMTGLSQDDDLRAAFAAGAIDYLTKPIKTTELLARLGSALQLKAQLDWRKEQEHELRALTEKLQDANRALLRLAITDELTGLANRRQFNHILKLEWTRARRERKPLALVMADLDHFKAFNDQYGHQCGDECLQAVADTLQFSLKRSGDLAARWGGEEFTLLLPNTDALGAMSLAEKLRNSVQSLHVGIERRNGQTGITLSLGVAVSEPGRQWSAETLIKAADFALYAAKREGRNRSCAFDETRDGLLLELRTSVHSN